MAEQEMTFTYQVQDFTVTVSTEEYIRRFSNSECFIKYCKECRNYGKVWVCPPFSHDTMAELRQYANLFWKRNQLNQQTIDDAFEDFEKIEEELSKTEKESHELYKLSVKQWFCKFLVSQGVTID